MIQSQYREIKYEDKEFPALLKEIPNPPERLFVKGELLTDEPCFAIVGTRKPSAYGREVAAEFSKNLVGCGFTIVSGLAFGIDEAAHQAAIEAGGRTIAVLPCGIEHVAPRSHTALAKEIISQGALISEFKPTEEARPEFFPRRNRIISGLSWGVLVVEAPAESGALITARHAAEQNRDVFAVPGQIYSKNFAGSHRLIQEGAKLVQSIDDILEEYKTRLPRKPPSQKTSDKNRAENETEKITELLAEAGEPLSREEIAEKIGFEPKKLQAALTLLELKGKIKRLADDTFILKNT